MKRPLLKHTLRVTLAVMALSTVTTGFARKLSPDEALSRANEFQQASASTQFRAPNRISAHGNVMRPDKLSLAYTAEKVGMENTPAYYVFNNSATEEGGFIIASGDDRLRPVLAVVDNGSFDPQNIPDNLKWWLSQYEEEINSYLSSPAALAAEMSASAIDNYNEWEVIPHLMTTTWNQGAPYNNLCPTVNSERTVTGCTATAFAQIINYHKFADLSKLKGTTKTYTTATNKTRVTYTYPSKFDFDNMLDDYSSDYTDTQANAVAELMKACGVMVEMDYSTVSNGSPSLTVAAAIQLGYDKSSIALQRACYQTAEWEKIIYNELKENRPVLYHGSATGGGHAFVCDGYSGGGMFHINWGWSGTSDGAFALSALNPVVQGIGSFEGGYNAFQGISIYVKPGDKAQDLQETDLSLYADPVVSGSQVTLNVLFESSTQTSKSCTYGLVLTDEAGNWLKTPSVQQTTTIKCGYVATASLTPSYTGVTIKANSKYYLVAAYKNSSSQWVEMPATTPSGTNRVLVTVGSNTNSKTLSVGESKYTPNLKWTLESEDDFYMGSTNYANFTVRNDGDADYTENLYGRLYNASNTSQSYDFEITGGSIIPAGATQQFDITFDFSSKNYTAGEWIVQLGRKFNNKVVMFDGQQKITINEGNPPVIKNPTPPDIDRAIEFHSSTPREWIKGQKVAIWFNVIVKNAGDLSYLAYLIYERGTSKVAAGPYAIGLGTVSENTTRYFNFTPNMSAGLYDFVFYTYNNSTLASGRIPISVGDTVDGVTYTLALDGSGAKIASWPEFSDDLTVPGTVTLNETEYPVIGIGASMFENSSISSAVIPASIKSIGSKAFASTKSLENVYFYGSCPFKFAETAFLLTNPDVNVYVNEADYDDYKASFATITDNVYARIDSWSLESNEITIKEGESATLKINRDVTANFNPGVIVSDNYDSSVAEITVADDANTITVNGLTPGSFEVNVSLAQDNLSAEKIKVTVKKDDSMFDVNGDGSINVADIATMVSYMIADDNDKLAACDFNNDNVINVGDLNFAVNYIVGGGVDNIASALGSGIKSLPVDFGYNGRYIAMQADFRVDGDGLLRFVELNKALAGSHILSWGRPENGVVRVMVFSLKNSLINLSEGAPVFNLGIEGSLNIECTDLMFIDENLNTIKVTPSSVGCVGADSEIVAVEYFDLAGRRLAKPAGVCIKRTLSADGSVTVSKITR